MSTTELRFASEHLPPEKQAMAQQMNLDEAAVPAYRLPGVQSPNAADFMQKERPQILRDFERYMYGPIPPRPASMAFEIAEECDHAFDGLAVRRQIAIHCAQNGFRRTLHLLLYIPNARSGRVPVFFGLNFRGSHGTTGDPGVLYTVEKCYPTLYNSPRFADSTALPEERGIDASRWDFETVLKRGYASATIRYFDAYPDHPMGFPDSALRMYCNEAAFNSDARPCGAISAWAWAISRAIDCLETQPELDAGKIAVHGLSRLGKAALWAGANDTRIALTVSCCSGTCGAKLSHRYYGEDFSWINLWNPHWMVPAFRQFVNHDREIPVDQHQLIGCIAPRLAYITSATQDCYADPRGEFLAGAAASQYYRLFGSDGISTDVQPPPGTPLFGDIGYYLRAGAHNITPENWAALLDYADARLKPGKTAEKTENTWFCSTQR